jgi:hypothetical protein
VHICYDEVIYVLRLKDRCQLAAKKDRFHESSTTPVGEIPGRHQNKMPLCWDSGNSTPSGCKKFWYCNEVNMQLRQLPQ